MTCLLASVLCVFALFYISTASFLLPNIAQQLEYARKARETRENSALNLRSLVDQLASAPNMIKEKVSANRRDTAEQAMPIFGIPLTQFHKMKKSLSDMEISKRDAVNSVNTQLNQLVEGVKAAKTAIENQQLSRRDSHNVVRSVFGMLPFHLVKKSLDEGSSKRAAEDNVREQINQLVDGINMAAGLEDSEEQSKMSRRGGQIVGLGGTCGRLNDTCGPFTTHCCDDLKCSDKWYQVEGVCERPLQRGGQFIGMGGTCGMAGEACGPLKTHCCDNFKCNNRWNELNGVCVQKQRG